MASWTSDLQSDAEADDDDDGGGGGGGAAAGGLDPLFLTYAFAQLLGCLLILGRAVALVVANVRAARKVHAEALWANPPAVVMIFFPVIICGAASVSLPDNSTP